MHFHGAWLNAAVATSLEGVKANRETKMFGVINVLECRDIAIQRFDLLLAAVYRGDVNDATGGRMSYITMEEAYGLVRTTIQEIVQYDATLAHRYLTQFPEILTMELVGAKVSDSIEQGLRRAVFGRIEADIRGVVLAQYSNYGICDLTRAVSTALDLFERYLVNDPFASLRIRPAKIMSQLSSVVVSPCEKDLKILMSQLGNVVSELRTRTLDSRHAARALKEANQFCAFLVSGELTQALKIEAVSDIALAG
jgi:hypothetical protein